MLLLNYVIVTSKRAARSMELENDRGHRFQEHQKYDLHYTTIKQKLHRSK